MKSGFTCWPEDQRFHLKLKAMNWWTSRHRRAV
jgi:hypothetical protein